MSKQDPRVSVNRSAACTWAAKWVIESICLSLVLFCIKCIHAGREAARQTQWQNFQKQSELRRRNYRDTFEFSLSGNVCSADDTLIQPWGDPLAPYLDADPLLSRIDSQFPWNDPSVAARLMVYANCAHGDPISRLGDYVALHQFRDITSGTTHTMMLENAAGDLAPMAGPPELRPSREQVAKPPGAWYPRHILKDEP